MANKALLIGINRYKVPGSDLRGCVNDVANLRDVLIEHCGFTSSGVRTITDLKATRAAMQKGIAQLIDGARKGDVLLLHYSGHGSNVPDKNGDEADKRDEILCPTDLDWLDPLTDDWLRGAFDRLPAGVNFTVLMDCCHSGTITRAIEPPDVEIKERYLPSPLDLLAVESGRKLRGVVKSLRKKRPAKGNVVTVTMPEVLISGCRADQTSADAFISGDYHGAMTYSLVRALKRKRGKLSYRELHAEMLSYLKGRYTQVPQLEGSSANLDRRFLAPL